MIGRWPKLLEITPILKSVEPKPILSKITSIVTKIMQRNSGKILISSKSPPPPKKKEKSLRDGHQHFILDNNDMANILNSYFTTIGPSLAASINDPWVYNGPILNCTLNEIFHVEN